MGFSDYQFIAVDSVTTLPNLELSLSLYLSIYLSIDLSINVCACMSVYKQYRQTAIVEKLPKIDSLSFLNDCESWSGMLLVQA